MKKLSFTTFLLLCAAMVFAQINFEHGTWSEVKKKASTEGKLIFVDSYTTWCGPCKWMSKNVFTDKKVADLYNAKFINYKLDMEKGEGLDFARHYSVQAYPTLLFIDGDGEVLHKQLGALPVEQFVTLGKTALDPDKQISTLTKRFNKGNREPEFLKTYLTGMLNAGMTPGDVADQYFAGLSDEELITKDNYNLIRMMRPSMNSPQFKKVMRHMDSFGAQVGKEEVAGFIKNTCKQDLTKLAYHGKSAEYKKAIQEIESMEMAFSDEVVTFGNMQYGKMNEDYGMFMSNAKRYLKKFVGDDWSFLNGTAWDIYEDEKYAAKSYLKLGKKMAKKSIALDKNYYNTDTYAALLYKSGSYKKALVWANEAVAQARAAGDDPSETEGLIKKIKAAM